MDLWVQAAKDRIFNSPYGRHVVERMQAAFDTHMNVTDKHILVIGSERPWIEAMLLAAGAQHVTSMDYTKLTTDHPRVCLFQPLCCTSSKYCWKLLPVCGELCKQLSMFWPLA